MVISIIVALAENGVIGYKNKLPWHLPTDLKRFKKLTTGHHVLMGLTTFNSIGKPLPDRTNIVLSDVKNQKINGCIVVNSLEDGINYAKDNNEREMFIIGGASVYKQTIDLANKLYLTFISHKFKGDTYFPKIDKAVWKETSRIKNKSDKNNLFDFDFVVYKRR